VIRAPIAGVGSMRLGPNYLLTSRKTRKRFIMFVFEQPGKQWL
jgi:hypothetical protein